jgi:hypothetical protein
MPVVPITDMTIKNNDLVVGTQGRSIYIIDDLAVVQQYDGAIADKNLHVFAPAPNVRMISQGGGWRGAGGTVKNAGQNPPRGITIPYHVKQAPDSVKGSVTILDKNRKTIKTFSTSSKDNKLELNPGMNRFTWDLRYPEGEKIPEGLILWNRANMVITAPPGQYYAKFKVGADSSEVPFTLLPDPNYPITQADYEAQFAMLRKIQGKFDETMKAQRDIQDLRKQMNEYKDRLGKDMPDEVKAMSDSIGKKLTAVEDALHQTKAKSGQDVLNYPIKLDDKLSSIYRVAAAGNAAPSKQVVDAYEALAPQIDDQLGKLKTVLNDDLPKLNALIREKSLPVIGVKKQAKEQ